MRRMLFKRMEYIQMPRKGRCNCTYAEVDECCLRSAEDTTREQMETDAENCVHLSLLARGEKLELDLD